MTLLALYWSIMIACYLLASRLRKYAEKFKFVDKLMSLSVYALVLLMGLRMGAHEEVTSSLGSIGIQALFVTVLTAAGSYTVKATFPETENYNAVTATADFTITKATYNLSLIHI